MVYAVICNVHKYIKPNEDWGDALLRILQREINAIHGNKSIKSYLAIIDHPKDYETISSNMSKWLHVVVTRHGGMVAIPTSNQSVKVADFFELPELTDVSITIIIGCWETNPCHFSMKKLLQTYNMIDIVNILCHGPSQTANEHDIHHIIAKQCALAKKHIGLNEVIAVTKKIVKDLVPFPACIFDFLVSDFSELSYYDKDWLYYDVSKLNLDNYLS